MSYELTNLLNRCTKDDVDLLISTIDSKVNFTDGKGLKELNENWDGTDKIPIDLNHKLEQEIRYLGSNDFAYLSRKVRGHKPAGVSVHEIIDDLCKMLKFKIDKKLTLEDRLEIFSQKMIDKQFANLPDDKKREIIDEMNFDEYHKNEVLEQLINKKEMLMPVIIPLLTNTAGPTVLQTLISSVIAPYLGRQAAAQLATHIATKASGLGALLGPLALAGGAGWLVKDLSGPATRKTIPLLLYMGILSFRDGYSSKFTENLQK